MSLTHFVLRYAHITAGLLTLTCGILAMVFPKGSRPHRVVGNVFFVSMLVLASSGVILSLTDTPNMGNIMGGTTAIYMVCTAWATVIRPPGRIGSFELFAALTGLGCRGARRKGRSDPGRERIRWSGHPDRRRLGPVPNSSGSDTGVPSASRRVIHLR